MFSQTVLVGRLGGDPELKYTSSGTAKVQFSLATDDYYKEEKHTDWHDIVVWGRQAEIIAEYGGKGRMILVVGKMKKDSWEYEGKKYTKHYVLVREFKFIGTFKETSREEGGGAPDRSYNDDDVPF